VIDGAEAEAGDDYEREVQGFREVGDKVIIADRDEEAPCPFDENDFVTFSQLLIGSQNFSEVNGLALEFGGDAGSQWMSKVDGIDHVEWLLVIHDRRVDFGVVASTFAAGDGFEGGGTHATAT